jgi:methylase of polypeptide subunit release factors
MSWSLDAAKNLIARCSQLRAAGRTEAVLRAEFQSWLRQVFPNPEDESWVNHYSEGAETHTKIRTDAGATASRFIDNLVRSTVVEYEADLRHAGIREHGFDQVREYVAGTVRAGTPISQIRGVLSDTVEWHIFDAELAAGAAPQACKKSDVTLREIESFEPTVASDESAHRFVAFLKRHLAREQSRALTATNVATDIGLESLPFHRHVGALLRLVNNGRAADSSIALATDLWSTFVDGLERARRGFRPAMYVDEMYVAILARFLAANVLEAKAILSDDAGLSEILSGDYFTVKFRLKNMVEDDYFGWMLREPYLTELLSVCREIQLDLYAYDFSTLEEHDLFGRLMAQLARRSQRKLLGQEWTPTWLARQLAVRCLELLPDGEEPRVVDMCCGSGSILAEVIKEYVRRQRGADIDRIASAATGFDIDPLAVMLAKTTWVVALAPRLKNAGDDILIPIYHADSLFATTPISAVPAPGDESDIAIELDGRKVMLPAELIRPEFRAIFDDIVDWAYDEARSAVSGERGNIAATRASTLIDSLAEKHAVSISASLQPRIMAAAAQLAKRMADLAAAKRDGIWAFILRNTYRPGLLVSQFNCLVSNPPWLAMSHLANNPYKMQLSKRAQLYGIKPAGASHLHLELATTYLIHAIDRYLKPGAAVTCLVPGTIFKGHHQQKFREAAYLSGPRRVPFELQEVWEVAKGTFKVRSAVVVGIKRNSPSEVVAGSKGFYVDQNGLTELGFTVLQRDKRTAWILSDTASSVASGPTESVPPQGADLMPRTAVCVEVIAQNGSEWQIRTPPPTSPLFFSVKAAKELKGKNFPGFVAPRFLFTMVQSLNLLPFVCNGPFATVALPARKRSSGKWEMLEPSEIRTLGFRQSALRFERINEAIAKSKAGKPLADRINERNKLIIQEFSKDHYLVLSGAGGGISCGACLPVNECKGAVIDQTLYWRMVSTRMEAWYRVGFLNSDAITNAIKLFNPEGEFGARHAHTLPHRFIPRFDQDNKAHLRIAQLAEAMSKRASGVIAQHPELGDPNKTIASRRRKLRTLLRGLSEFKDLEKVCETVLRTHSPRKAAT